ncbi:MAG: hypothetical protein ABIZ80_09920 [Bryobacteraceae bacterium]
MIAENTQIAAAFGWVAVYSYLINPGQPMAAYEAQAQVSGPWGLPPRRRADLLRRQSLDREIAAHRPRNVRDFCCC